MSEPSAGLALAWRIAASEAGLCGSLKIECPHLLMGLLSLDKANPNALKALGFDAAQMARVEIERTAITALLDGVGTSPAELRRRLRARLKGKASRAKGLMSRSTASKDAFTRAETLAGKSPMNSLHLLSVVLQEPDPAIVELVAEKHLGADVAAKARVAAGEVLKNLAAHLAASQTRALAVSPTPLKVQVPAKAAAGPGTPAPSARAKTGPTKVPKHQSLLSVFGRDLTALAQDESIGPISGRRKEIASVLQTLAQTTRCNPLLVGDAGVGKAAVVEAVAIRGATGKDPLVLGGKRIVELDVSAFLTGTEYRGELEKRMKLLLEEIQRTKDVILFIDGIHRLVGTGRVGQDSGNLLKAALARGDIKVIGAITIQDFRERIEKDAALDARFERIDVPEPAVNETLEIIRGMRTRIEKQHYVQIPDASIDAAVSLSIRFDPDQRLPHKAVDLIVRAATKVGHKPSGKATAPAPPATVEPRAIAEALAEKRGLPIDLVTDGTGEGARLAKLEAHLKSRVGGQDEAIAQIANRIKLAYSGLAERRGPVATFLVLGPKGVGQTEMARSLAKFLSGNAESLLRLKMAEFAEPVGASKLVGAAGASSGLLVDAIRRSPRAVLLIDDIEKAHTKVSDILLHLFDTGEVLDGQGHAADARSTIVIMTSHLGEADAAQAAFAAGETVPMVKGSKSKTSLRKLFRREILNRVDEIVSFRPLDEADVRRIARPLLAQVVNRVRKTHGIFLRFEPEAEAFVVKSGFSAETGVSELQPSIERLVEIPLAKLGVSGKLSKHPVWNAVMEKGVLTLTPERT